MNIFTALDINATGLTAQRQRIEVISSNLANASTTRTTEGGPYRRKDLVFESTSPESSFASAFSAQLESGVEQAVQVIGIYEDASPFIRKYEPAHPDADAEGYVTYPNVSPIEEMVNLLSATRSFEANTQAINAIKEIAAKSVEIGR
ncbi:MAG: flagellar basal body rod protein FlgC [Acidobacteria bacterium]|nr:MAG: flagellar basal body rod protein FlgC [Acidobacteriota bacterium]